MQLNTNSKTIINIYVKNQITMLQRLTKTLLTAVMLIVSLGATPVFAQMVQKNTVQIKKDTVLSEKKTNRPFSLENDRLQEKELVKQKHSQFANEFDLKKVKANFKSSDAQERLNAVEISGYFPENNLIDDVENLLLTDKSSEVRQQCVQTLQMIGNKKAIPALVSALNDSDRTVQILSAVALAELGEKEKTSVAANALWNKGRKGAPIYSCHFMFRDLATEEAIDNLAHDLNNEDPYIAVDAAICLAQMGQSAKAFPFLQQALTNDDRYMRMAALRGLAYIGDNASLGLIQTRINDEDNLVSEQAMNILKNFNNNINQ